MDKTVTIQATYFNQKEYQLQGRNHFEIQFEGNKWSKAETLLVKSFPLPKERTEINTLDHFNQQIKLAGKTTFEGGSLVIHDAIDKDVELLFRKWRKTVYDAATGKVGYASDYKVNGYVIEYSPNGEKARKWKLIGCWPSDVDYGDLDYETGGYKDLTATITYDWAYRVDDNNNPVD